MTVSCEVTLEVIRRELAAAAHFARAVGLMVDTDQLSNQRPCFVVTFENRDGNRFHVEFDCQNYPLYPPTVEFVSGDRSERGIARLYPTGLHPMPCVCMRYNRKAYQERGGPHGDWRLVDWRLPTGQGVAIDTLAMMFSDLDSKIRQSTGMMG